MPNLAPPPASLTKQQWACSAQRPQDSLWLRQCTPTRPLCRATLQSIRLYLNVPYGELVGGNL